MSRSRMIWISPVLALLPLGFGLAYAQNGAGARQPARGQQVAADPQPPHMTMPQLLSLWEGQSAKLQTLELDMYRVDTDPQWGDEEHYLGHAAFRTPQLAFLDFKKVKMKEQADPKDKRKKQFVPLKKDGHVESVSYETIVCTGDEVWQYRYDVRQIYIYPLDKDQRKRALEEGPLPFLFNMRAAEANRRYQMHLKGEDKTRYLVVVNPLLQADRDTFSLAWIYLDKQSLLPTRVCLLGPDRRSTKDFRMTRIAANKPVKDIYFQGINPNKYFKIIRNPGGSDPQVKARGRRRQQPDQDARRPAGAGAQTPQ